MSRKTRFVLLLVWLLALLAAPGCALLTNPSSETIVNYESKDGRKVYYKSNKQQQGLSVTFSEDKTGKVEAVVKVDNSSTQESIVALMLEQGRAFIGALEKLLAMIPASAATGS